MSFFRVLFALLLLLLLGCLPAVLAGLVRANRIIAQKGGIRSAYEAEKKRTDYVPLDAISPELIAVVVNVEDFNFFEHKGYDIPGILRAIRMNISAGQIEAGGSTITQQLCKNVFLTPEKTLRRKITELFLSIQTEKTLSKQEILEWYFNILNFETGFVGICRISEALYQKKPCRIGFREAIAIAGSLPCPISYLPGEEFYPAAFRKCVCWLEYWAFISKEDSDAVRAMVGRDDPLMEEKYSAKSRRYCEAKGLCLSSLPTPKRRESFPLPKRTE